MIFIIKLKIVLVNQMSEVKTDKIQKCIALCAPIDDCNLTIKAIEQLDALVKRVRDAEKDCTGCISDATECRFCSRPKGA